MKRKGAKKEVYLGIDQGSSTTKVVVVTPEGKVLHQSRKGVKTTFSGSSVYQEPRAILRSVKSALADSLSFVRERNLAVRGAGFATQRSSFLYFDRKGRALSPVVSWRDTSTAALTKRLGPVEARIREVTGLPLTPYYSALKMKKHLPTRHAGIHFGTVNTYLVYALTGGKVFATDPANAQRTLLFDIHKLDYSRELLQLFSIPGKVRLPEVRDTAGDFGLLSLKKAAIPILSSTGDQQAAFFGSSGWETGRGLINLGTGGFLLVPGASRPGERGGLIVTLSHTMKKSPSFLLEGTVNAVSDTLHYFESLLGKKFREQKLKGGPYPAVIFGGRGTGAPLWDPPFPAALSGLAENTDKHTLLGSSLLGSLCYFRLIDEAIAREGWEATGYVVSGGISRVNGVSQFLRDLIGKPVYPSKAVELTGTGAALSAMVLGERCPFPKRKRDFLPVSGKSPTDAGAYFAEWLKLYTLARQKGET